MNRITLFLSLLISEGFGAELPRGNLFEIWIEVTPANSRHVLQMLTVPTSKLLGTLRMPLDWQKPGQYLLRSTA